MKKIITPFIIACFSIPAAAQSFVGFEAESGAAGSEWATTTAEGNNIIYITTNGGGNNPGSANRVISYSVTFPQAGTYNLYARMRVGSGTYNDDSYFIGNGFGAKSPSTDNNWVLANGLASAGYTLATDIVSGTGTAGSNVFKWVNMSVFAGKTYEVTDGNLTQTFEIGGREDGLDLDKFVFGLASYTYTVDNLDKGEDGSNYPPPDPYNPPGPPIAEGKAKFLGGIYSNAQKPNFNKYWNQVTPENGGKWGSVESTRDVMNWADLDSSYKLAKDNGYLFKLHTLIWGAQQPSWMSSLSAAEQLDEIKEWYAALAERYPGIDIIEVVNEPLHQPPSYKDALGGDGATGWDWLLEAFRLARQYFPNAKLWINDYSIINDGNATTRYMQIINLLKAENLIDGIGEQGHAFTTFYASVATMRSNLNTLASSGLPLYITELDIDGAPVQTPSGDSTQLREYQRVFPLFWEYPDIHGVTVWGYLPGHWRSAQGAYLAYSNGGERPALVWLREYVNNTKPVINEGQVFSLAEDASNGTALGQPALTDPDEGQVYAKASWQITGGTGVGRFTIDPLTGAITLTDNSGFDFESDPHSFTLKLLYNDGFTASDTATITVNLTNINDNAPAIASGLSFDIDGGTCNEIGTVTAADADDTNEPGFTTFQNWQIVGSKGASLFKIDSATGIISIDKINLGYLITKLAASFPSSFTLMVTVSDGVHTSAEQAVTIIIPNRITVCHNGSQLTLPRAGALAHLLHGDCTGSCSVPAVSSNDALKNAPALLADIIKVYPNPARERINITLGNNVNRVNKVQLIDVSGRIVKDMVVSAENANVVTISAGNLQSGTYFVRLIGNTIQNYKIVIQK